MDVRRLPSNLQGPVGPSIIARLCAIVLLADLSLVWHVSFVRLERGASAVFLSVACADAKSLLDACADV